MSPAKTPAALDVAEALRTNFIQDDAFVTWRVLARNTQYTGETEGFGFSNGMATVHGLPRSVRCAEGTLIKCYATGELCRLHARIQHLNNLKNYPFTYTEFGERDGKRVPLRNHTVNGYRVLSEEEYDAEFGDAPLEDVSDL